MIRWLPNMHHARSIFLMGGLTNMPSKRRAVLIVSIYISLLLMLFSGCSESNSTNDPYSYTSTRNFYRDEYDPQYRHYDDIIPVDKTTSKAIDIEAMSLRERSPFKFLIRKVKKYKRYRLTNRQEKASLWMKNTANGKC